jgi:hypothetical protein
MAGPFTRYNQMPIDHVDSQTEYFEAGAITIGVEYRLLTDAIAAANDIDTADGDTTGPQEEVDDRGVSLHVFSNAGGKLVEHLRFDCFDEDPHYHYVSWAEKRNEIAHLEPISMGDPLQWALDRIRTRLPQMLARAGANELAASLDCAAVDAALPRVTEAAFRARYNHDDEEVNARAIQAGAAG